MSQALVEKIVFESIDVHNQLYPDHPLDKVSTTGLYGTTSGLDSLMFVSLLLDVEDRLARQAGWSVTLADAKAFSPYSSPFRDVGSLVGFILQQQGR